MKTSLFGFLLVVMLIFIAARKQSHNMHAYSYLAIGDSYTIGESVPEKESFPFQLVEMLRKNGKDFDDPEIIAKTGWTTDELQAAINKHHFKPKYDLVTLLIGVNNQYRGRSVEDYEPEFESLLQQAIAFAGNDTSHVIVVSIPDWGVTPFAADRNRQQIATEIDAYNAANKKIAEKYHVAYADITPGSKDAATDPSLVTTDGLHPSGKEYEKWAAKILPLMH